MGYAEEEVTAQGFRVSTSTILNERGYDPDVIESVLAHQEEYHPADIQPRLILGSAREALQEWADLGAERIMASVSGGAASNTTEQLAA